MRNPRQFARPLAIGAPPPPAEIPVRPMRNIHFFDPSNPKLRERASDMAQEVDILLGNLEDSIPADKKVDARRGLIEVARGHDPAQAQLWTRINSLDSPWFLDDMLELVAEAGHVLDVIMVPKVNGRRELEYVDQLLAQLEARHGVTRPILVHAILESAAGVANVEEIAVATPRMHGMSLGPSDLAASRQMKTTRVGGPHPGYLVRTDQTDEASADRSIFLQDLWHYTLARMVDACRAAEIFPFYGPFGDFSDSQGCEDQFRNAFILGCVGAWTLHPSQIPIAKRVFQPDPDEVRFARRVIAAMGDGSGVAMVDGKMQDDATFKQCRVIVGVADMLAAKDPAAAALYAVAD